MRSPRPNLFLLVVGICASCAGCRQYSDVFVRAWDAETGEEIETGTACVKHNRMSALDFFPPGESCAPFNGGAAKVRADHTHLPHLFLKAAGYLPGNAYIPDPFLNNLPRPQHIDVRLYREPAPVVKLTLPVGYRGVVKVGFRSRGAGDAPYLPGQRLFHVQVKGSGVHWLASSPLLDSSAAFYAEHADATPLPSTRWGYADSVALRAANGYNLDVPRAVVQVFFVGRVDEYRQFIQGLPKSSTLDLPVMEGLGDGGASTQPTMLHSTQQ